MVDALSRLFGKGSKKNSGTALPNLDTAAPMPAVENSSSDENFTLISGNNMYPVIPDNNALPSYPVRPNTMPDNAGHNVNAHTHNPNNACQDVNVLDRITFTLSPRLRLGASESGDGVRLLLDEAEALLQQVSDVLHDTNFDFRLERGVVDADITDTMRRMNTN